MRRVFKDDVLQKKIESDGFVVIPFLDSEGVAKLKALYESFDPVIKKDFYLSIWSDQQEYKEQTHRAILEIVEPVANQVLENYKSVVSNFAVKHPGGSSEFDLHQGINFIDETKGVSITIWIPLQDVFPENGNMQVVRGSHKFFDQDIRSQHYQTPFDAIKPFIKKNFVENLPMKAGEAWIFNHRLLHCSPINITDKVRIATLNVFVPSEAPVILYFKPQDKCLETEAEILEFTEDNYFAQNVEGKPNLPGIVSKGVVKEKHYKVSEAEFRKLYEQHNPAAKKSFIKKVMSKLTL
jgi:hypothetical protein